MSKATDITALEKIISIGIIAAVIYATAPLLALLIVLDYTRPINERADWYE